MWWRPYVLSFMRRLIFGEAEEEDSWASAWGWEVWAKEGTSWEGEVNGKGGC